MNDATGTGDFDAFARTADLRRALADETATFTTEQWAHPSLCRGWSVRDVVGHVVVPLVVSIPRFALTMLRERGRFDRANDRLARKTAARFGADLPAVLRDRADRRFVPPGGVPAFQLADVMIHGQDSAGHSASPTASLSKTCGPCSVCCARLS